ncbi:MAG: FHA domain-containing protein [Planctomycetes bacterium]|nr:FHA domain-containing protein [Planctomycetota bacterium]
MPRLIIIRGKDAGRILELKAGQRIRIGRRSDNDLSLDDSTLSRHHCEIHFDGKTVHIRDNRSRHGTRVNGERIEEADLGDKDEIQLGATHLRLRMDSDSRNAAAAARVREEEEEEETRPPESLGFKGDSSPAVHPVGGLSDLVGFKPKAPENPQIVERMPSGESPASSLPHEAPTGPQPVSELRTQVRRRRNWFTVAALGGVTVLVLLAALLLVSTFDQPPEHQRVPIEKLEDVSIRVLSVRKLLDRPPTYVLEVEVANRTEQSMRVAVKDFQAVDGAGMTYTPANPTARTDFRNVTIAAKDSARGHLTFELNFGAALARLYFQDRGIVPIEE